jgi:hypothetical protein
MKSFLVFMFVWFVLETLARVFLVAAYPYPRKIPKAADALNIVVNGTVMLWAAALLFG